MRTRLVIALVVVAGGLATPIATAQSRECERSDLRVRFRVDQRVYERDEPVRMRMKIVNEGPPCTMVWSNGEIATFYIFEDDRRVWNRNKCRVFTQATIEEEWERGHREVYRAKWRHWKSGVKDGACTRHAERTGAGRYEAQGHFKGDGEPRTGKKAFRVVR